MRSTISLIQITLGVSCLAIAACGGSATTSQTSPNGQAGVASVLKVSASSTVSPNGTAIPAATEIIDSGGNTWTVSRGVIYENGALAGYSNAVTRLMYENDVIYQENSAGGWWSWNGNTWIASSNPPAMGGACGTTNGMAVKRTPVANLCSTGTASTVSGTGPWTWSCGGSNGGKTASCSAGVATTAAVASPDGTTFASATEIIDSGGNTWTVSRGVIYKNGALAGYSNAVTLLLYDNNIIYQENSAGGWWSWNGSTWIASSNPRKVAASNAAPLSISGTPPASDNAGQAYDFVPTIANPDGGTLDFSIANMPSWARFSTLTGALTGTPSSTQVGTYPGILISVGNGSASSSLAAFSITVTTGSASLSWTAPTQNTNGSPLTDLAGYTIYYGTSADELTQTIHLADASATSYVVGNLGAGTYYFTIAAYTTAGTQSAQSTVGSTTIL